jgi:hypothetical protein
VVQLRIVTELGEDLIEVVGAEHFGAEPAVLLRQLCDLL